MAVVAVVVAAFTLLGQGGSDDGNTADTASEVHATATAQDAAEAASTPGVAAPRLPPGADPALSRKPRVTAGQGQLTKLVVTPLIKGRGPAATPGQQLTVNYVGVTYSTGQEFDASWNGGEPFSFTLGQGGVIKGWDQGLAGVTVGSRVQLDIPSDLAYGDNPTGGQPAGSLRFVVDLLDAR